MKKENKFLQAGKYIFYLSIAIVFGLFSFYYFKIGLKNTYQEEVTYKSSSNVSYKVYLLENDYFDEPYLGMNRTYISSLINYIDINFNYNLNFSNFVSGKYTYYIKGIIVADKVKDDDSSYWSKSYILKEPETISYDNQNSFNIDTNVKVDYQKYNTILNEFRKDYGISFDGAFKVQLVIESESNAINIKENIPVESLIEVRVPLTQQVIDLSIDLSNNDNEGKISETIVNNTSSNYVFLGLGILFITVTLCLLWIVFRYIISIYLSKSKYSKTLKKILSTYDTIIVNVSSLPNLNDLKVIEVNTFSELIDANSEVRMPINYYEEVADCKSVFVLVSTNMAWVYTLINHEYEKKLANSKIKKAKKKNTTANTKVLNDKDK